ncbi:MAG: hypothetical protein E6109_11870 [Ruminococcus sp.]|nr:hypothetical protein [Ruminococcus sp.]
MKRYLLRRLVVPHGKQTVKQLGMGRAGANLLCTATVYGSRGFGFCL